VGGLTVLHECLVSLPEEDFVYLGDSAMFPYGIKPADEVQARVEAIARYLLARGAKLLVIACNSATSVGGEAVRELAGERGVDVVSVIEPEAEIAAAITDNGRVGVLATPATGRGLEVTEIAAPDLAPIIQHGSPFSQAVVDIVRTYCGPLRNIGVDTLILGCTHYPLVSPMLQRILGRNVRLVTAGHAVAAAAQRALDERGLASASDGEGGEGDYRFLCTGDVASFRELGTRFLQMPLGEVERVVVE
jgi:glutamate racemase